MSDVRDAYTLRTPLNYSWMDIVINPSTSRSKITTKYEVTVRTLLTAGVAILLGFWMRSLSFLAYGGFLANVGFYAGYAIFVCLLVMPTATQQTGYQLIKPMYHFFIDRNQYRRVQTRAVSPIKPVDDLIGIRGITKNGIGPENSLIVFSNGDVGEILELSGNASIMTFREERAAIVKATEIFLKRLKRLNVSITFDSVSSVQRVGRQVRRKDVLLKNLQIDDPKVVNSLKYQKYLISHYVGLRYHAWHQYAIVRGSNPDTIRELNIWLRQCTDKDNLFVKSYYRLKPEEMLRRLRDLYGNDVSNIQFENEEGV